MEQRFVVTAEALVRRAARADLNNLEWHGMFTKHRAVIADAYERQQRGEVLMLVTEVARFPVAQIWIDFVQCGDDAAQLWAFRVMPGVQRLGIGSRLLHTAERVVIGRGLRFAELGCEKGNARAWRFYQKRGYVPVREQVDHYSYMTPAGERIDATSDQWILRKQVRSSA
jgi:ribosomal protein S18 acetylase RimI-like enzyme